MAGLPPQLVERAREILTNLESNELTPHSQKPRLAKRHAGRNVDNKQLNLFPDETAVKVKNELNQIDINNLTPIEALNKLNELKKLLKNDNS
jgi:DNA mismatch repair protein MutS